MPRQTDPGSDPHSYREIEDETEAVVHCPACGQDNPATHKFCGNCGATIEVPRAFQHQSVNDRSRDDANRLETENDLAHDSSSPYPARGAKPVPQSFEHSITNPHELSLFRSFRPSDGSVDDDYEEDGPPYRIYIGFALALVLIGLGYMAWRSSQSNIQRVSEPPAAPPAATQPAQPPPEANTKSTAPGTKPTDTKAPSAGSKPVTKAPSTSNEEKTESPSSTAKEDAHGETAVDNGREELSTAQRYLNGSGGQPRDTAEAAKWLWRAIAKHNSQATLMLADLYLRGEGVAKNCDQARILLDSAARKGVSGAGERLRNLQAFGCQ